jgi:hypothetical protein
MSSNRLINLYGKKFNMLTVIGQYTRRKNKTFYLNIEL